MQEPWDAECSPMLMDTDRPLAPTAPQLDGNPGLWGLSSQPDFPAKTEPRGSSQSFQLGNRMPGVCHSSHFYGVIPETGEISLISQMGIFH